MIVRPITLYSSAEEVFTHHWNRALRYFGAADCFLCDEKKKLRMNYFAGYRAAAAIRSLAPKSWRISMPWSKVHLLLKRGAKANEAFRLLAREDLACSDT